MAVTIKIGGTDRTDRIDPATLNIVDSLDEANVAFFDFLCNDSGVAPITGEEVLIEEGSTRLFAGRVLAKHETLVPPTLLRYSVECIDYSIDLNKRLVIEEYTDELAGDIIKDIIDKYASGFTYTNVADGPALTRIAFDYISVFEALSQIAENSGYYWYVDYNKDIHYFQRTDKPASFQLDDNQEYYKDLQISTDISQLRNRVYVKSSQYETGDFTELFVGDGVTEEWTCKYQASALPAPSATLNDADKTVGWDGVDNPDDYDFMLNATTKVLSLGTNTSTPADGDEIVITYGADVPIVVRWDDQESIDAVKAIEGGDGIYEYSLVNNNIDNKDWAIRAAKADLLQNADPVIQGTFITNQTGLKSGQIITVDSAKRSINEDFLIQKVELTRLDVRVEYPSMPYKTAATATVGYKPAASAEIPYRSADGSAFIYYIYEVTIATKIKGLGGLLMDLLYYSNESLKKDTEPPDVPSGLALSTGMGETTQASLAWLKAEWDANEESDFSHYELKYKKTAHSDFGYVTTTNTSFLWTGLDQGVEYEVYIRAVDTSNNRSGWSSQQLQITATDSETPAQVTGATAEAILAGIKIEWTESTEDNLAEYAVERQESDDGTTWTASWVEIVRTKSTMWLDLYLTYTKYYRYRVTAVTQTGTEGTPSTPTADSIAPLKTGTNDIVADAITADLIASNAVLANHIKAGEIDTDHLAANAITAGKIAADAVEADKIKANAVTASKIDVSSLSAITATLGTVSSGTISSTRIKVGSGTNEDIYFEDSGIRLYDSGSNQLYFYKSGLASLGLFFSNGVRLYTDDDFISINPGSYIFSFLDSGVMKFPSRTTAPSASEGYHAFHKASGGAGDHLSFYDSYDTRWEHYHTESDW